MDERCSERSSRKRKYVSGTETRGWRTSVGAQARGMNALNPYSQSQTANRVAAATREGWRDGIRERRVCCGAGDAGKWQPPQASREDCCRERPNEWGRRRQEVSVFVMRSLVVQLQSYQRTISTTPSDSIKCLKNREIRVCRCVYIFAPILKSPGAGEREIQWNSIGQWTESPQKKFNSRLLKCMRVLGKVWKFQTFMEGILIQLTSESWTLEPRVLKSLKHFTKMQGTLNYQVESCTVGCQVSKNISVK